jgi:hypothetical protein
MNRLSDELHLNADIAWANIVHVVPFDRVVADEYHCLYQIINMQIKLALRAVPQNLKLIWSRPQLLNEIDNQALRRGHTDHILERKDVSASEVGFDGSADLGLRHEPNRAIA